MNIALRGINKVLLKNITVKITKAAYTSAYSFLLYVLQYKK